MMTDEDVERLNRLGRYMQAEFARIMPDVRRLLNKLHVLLSPEPHKRLMLRAAHQRARLSTQRRRVTR